MNKILLLLAFLTPYLGHSSEKSLGKIQITPKALSKLLTKYFNQEVIPNYTQKIMNLKIDELSFGAQSDKCNDADLKKMNFEDAWKNCPGLPNFFFDRYSEKLFWPKPSMITLNNININEFKINNFEFKCNEDQCHFSLELNSINIITDLKLNLIDDNRKVFDYKKISFYINSKNDDLIKLNLNLNLTNQKNTQFLDFSTAYSSFIFPKSTEVFLKFKGMNDPINLESQNLEDFKFLLNELDDQNNVMDFIFMASSLNQDIFTNDFFKSSIQSLFINTIIPFAINQANPLIFESFFNNFWNISLPHISFHDIINQKFMDKKTQLLIEKIEQLKLDNNLINSIDDLKKFYKNNCYKLTLNQISGYLNFIQKSNTQSDINIKFEEGLISLYESLINLKLNFSDYYKGTPKYLYRYISNLILDVQNCYKEVLKIKKNISNNKKSQTTYLKIKPKFDHGKIITIDLLSDEGTSINNGQGYDPILFEDYHLSTEFSLTSINSVLKKIHEKNILNFKIFFDNSLNHINPQDRVKLETTYPPEVSWDEEKSRYVLKIPEIYAEVRLIGPVKTYETLYFEFFFKPEIQNGKVTLNPKLEGQTKIISLKRPLTMIMNLLKLITIVHPQVTNLLIDKYIENKGEEVLSQSFDIPDTTITNTDIKIVPHKIETQKDHIKIYYRIE